jgi:hypothetical protein
MTAEEAGRIASHFMSERVAEHERQYGPSRFRHTLLGAKRHPGLRGEWAAVFEVRSIDGGVIDGPTLVLVGDATGEARFLD